MAEKTEQQRLQAIAEAHSRCADGRIAEGWQVEDVSVRCGGEWQSRPLAADHPFRTVGEEDAPAVRSNAW
ncbi:hypothetical protein [Lentzea sp. NPDC059081]|uniref:hypothetical protein n=1 Tax=Lentzea sp. NPDC059081 TaxID=3346719 RepID=UPI0036950B36